MIFMFHIVSFSTPKRPFDPSVSLYLQPAIDRIQLCVRSFVSSLSSFSSNFASSPSKFLVKLRVSLSSFSSNFASSLSGFSSNFASSLSSFSSNFASSLSSFSSNFASSPSSFHPASHSVSRLIFPPVPSAICYVCLQIFFCRSDMCILLSFDICTLYHCI